jgi:hypothetical protein
VFDASSYSTLGFTIQNSLPVEVVLVTENDWNNRLRFQIPANANATKCSFDKFTSPLDKNTTTRKSKELCFQYKGIIRFFKLQLLQLAFKNESTLSLASFVNTS